MTGRSPFEPVRPVDLLVRAALAPDAVARAAWEEWKANYGLDAASWGEVRMLGAVAARIERLDSDPATVPRVKGIRKFLWANTQENLRGAQFAIETLTALNIPCLLLKGSARIAGDERAAAERLIRDVDCLVPYERALEAFDALTAEGWTLGDWQPASRANGPRQSHHAWALRRGKAEFDLHHFSNFLNRMMGDDDGLWRRARQAEWRRSPVWLPDPTDGLIISLAHGVRKSSDGAADWAVDAAALLRQGQIDWALFEAEVHARMLEGLAYPALTYLESVIGIHSPAALLERLGDRISPVLHNEAQTYAQTDWPDDPSGIDAMFQGANLRAQATVMAFPPSQTPATSWRADPAQRILVTIDPPIDIIPDRPLTLIADGKWPAQSAGQGCEVMLDAPGLVFARRMVPIHNSQDGARLSFVFRLSSGLLRRREIDRVWFKLHFPDEASVPSAPVTISATWRY